MYMYVLWKFTKMILKVFKLHVELYIVFQYLTPNDSFDPQNTSCIHKIKMYRYRLLYRDFISGSSTWFFLLERIFIMWFLR